MCNKQRSVDEAFIIAERTGDSLALLAGCWRRAQSAAQADSDRTLAKTLPFCLAQDLKEEIEAALASRQTLVSGPQCGGRASRRKAELLSSHSTSPS